MLESVPFRFLDLPKELRLMVYENLTISAKQLRLIPQEDGLQAEHQATNPTDDGAAITVTLQSLPVQILRICKVIHCEALPFLTRTFEDIRGTGTIISLDSECLYTYALNSVQKLLQSLLDRLDHHPYFKAKPGTVCALSNIKKQQPQYPREIQQWLTQTTHLLLSQRPPPCPFSGFMGNSACPTVRLIIEVSKFWTRNPSSHSHAGTPPLYTASIETQLTELWHDLASYSKQLRHVKGGAIVYVQSAERKPTREGLVVKKTAAFDFGISGFVE